ncbi:gasdermin-E [Paramormyrops kingsleyae]|uniref:Gasdermin E n=1 Tax=Paramormyrops kingsleyae TaxID=1676925 RepID=A0A3B3SN57_9TELE|nr:gasdermin-E-like [Paramormyrops kingsleyae]
MFAKATRNFVNEIDPDGCLIPVSRLNNSDKLRMLSLIVKRKRHWFWKKPKYLPSNFSLSDVLVGEPICTDVMDSDFLKYEGIYADSLAGNMETEMGPAKVTMKSRSSSNLRSSFGSLKKEEVDVQKLLCASKGRYVNLEHCLIQQTQEKGNEVFGVLKERIFTTQHCSIMEKVKGHGSCGTGLTFFTPQSVKVSVTENGNREKDRSVSLEIPPHTVVAYSIIELVIKQNGQYELCLQPNTYGGFEETLVRSPSPKYPAGSLMEVDSSSSADLEDDQSIPPEAPLCVLEKYLEKLSPHFQKLADLPAEARSQLFCYLREILTDRAAVTILESVLDERCWNGGKKSQPQNETVVKLLEFLQANLEGLDQADGPQTTSFSLHTSVYLLISAIDEMTDAGLTWLEQSCDPAVLGALHHLVSRLVAAGECSLQDSHLTVLAEEGVYFKVQQLLASSEVTLQRETDTLWAATRPGSGRLPLVVCVAVRSLACLTLGHGCP